MRRLDDHAIDPEIAAQLDAIDATLAGEPVAPQHAELAELALLLAAARPELDPSFSRSLDERVQRRFAEPARASGSGSRSTSGSAAASGRGRWALGPVLGVVASGLAAVVVVVVLSSGGSGGPSQPTATLLSKGPSASGSAAAAAPSVTSAASPAAASGAPAPAAASGAGGSTLQPPANGRKIVQSAQLALTSAPNRIDVVAQEVFDVVGRENGIVNRSNVTGGGLDGYAQFELSVPSSSLPQTMAGLSRLRYAGVASRTDTTQDVNNQFVSITHRLADARALRTALLKQLANAVTQQQIDSLTARIHDAEASIASDQATLRGLNHQIDLSQITLTINPRATPVSHGNGSFTLGQAAHDAGRVLTVAAGVALITLAALVPVALLVALAWWIGAAVRRRRREQALDLA